MSCHVGAGGGPPGPPGPPGAPGFPVGPSINDIMSIIQSECASAMEYTVHRNLIKTLTIY